jgi:hypothetical protein
LRYWKMYLVKNIMFPFYFFRLPIIFGIEYCWYTFPSTVFSSLLLNCLHALIVLLLIIDRQELSEIQNTGRYRNNKENWICVSYFFRIKFKKKIKKLLWFIHKTTNHQPNRIPVEKASNPKTKCVFLPKIYGSLRFFSLLFISYSLSSPVSISIFLHFAITNLNLKLLSLHSLGKITNRT